MRRYLIYLLVFFAFLPLAFSLELPVPTGRYVSDYAGILSSQAVTFLEQRLGEFEQKTSNQLLVVAVPDLQGEEIEEFSIRLTEKWKAGHKGRDNGVILLIAKQERKVRIEVGYGLEGVLTDALSKLIIDNEITPYFKRGDFDRGVVAGTNSIIEVTAGTYEALPARGRGRATQKISGFFLALMILGLVSLLNRTMGRAVGYGAGGLYLGSRGGGGFGGGGGGGGFGGFSGGGGGFGGGGASGGW